MSSSPVPATLPYRAGVGILLLNAQNLVFTGRRIDQTAEAWQLPQGGIDEGEEPYPAALRELEEETSVRSVERLAESRDWLTYDLPPDLVGKVWKGRYRGQRQKWYALRFTGPDSEIDLKTSHPEFAAWKWLRMADLPNYIVPFKQPLYQKLVAEFGHLAGG
jgi:putative (di)nucleoside polyphosphate hydrolase